jgi:hypothetical protein
MIVNFNGKIAKDIWETNKSRSVPKELWTRAKALLTIMCSTNTLNDLKIKGEAPNIRLHKLKGVSYDQKHNASSPGKSP